MLLYVIPCLIFSFPLKYGISTLIFVSVSLVYSKPELIKVKDLGFFFFFVLFCVVCVLDGEDLSTFITGEKDLVRKKILKM